jgi:hypothetical protein
MGINFKLLVIAPLFPHPAHSGFEMAGEARRVENR